MEAFFSQKLIWGVRWKPSDSPNKKSESEGFLPVLKNEKIIQIYAISPPNRRRLFRKRENDIYARAASCLEEPFAQGAAF